MRKVFIPIEFFLNLCTVSVPEKKKELEVEPNRGKAEEDETASTPTDLPLSTTYSSLTSAVSSWRQRMWEDTNSFARVSPYFERPGAIGSSSASNGSVSTGSSSAKNLWVGISLETVVEYFFHSCPDMGHDVKIGLAPKDDKKEFIFSVSILILIQ